MSTPGKSLGDLLDQRDDDYSNNKQQLLDELKKIELPDHDRMAEELVLSGILLTPDDSLSACEETGLRSSDFYISKNQYVYEAILSLKRKNKEIDVLTVCDQLNRRARLNKVGGVSFLTHLTSTLTSSASAKVYANLVVEKSRLRQLGEKLLSATLDIKSGKANANEVIDEIRKEMSEIEVRGGSSSFDMHQVTNNVLKTLPALGGKRDTMATGFSDLDNLIGGLSGGDLVIVAGRPSMGKTCWGLDVAREVAVSKGKPVLIFSLEMTSEQLTERLVGAEAGVSTKLSTFNDRQKSSVISAAGVIGDAPITIDDAAGLSVADIRARTRKVFNKHPLSLVVIDYIQLLTSSRDLSNRAGEMSETSNSLKRLARELRVPVIAISQLNRGPEARLDKRPLMSDLRESGAIEQDADMVMLLYREEYYGKDKTPEEAKGVAECIISKNRNGPTGMVKLKFASEIPRFDNLAMNEVIYSYEYDD